MADAPKTDKRSSFPNLIGWLSFIGLFATGIIGLAGATHRSGPDFAGAAYLAIGGLAFWALLALVLRRT
ncbi:MAG TPA: hypothetical protein VGE74_19430 [Gemmata sp.]